MTDIFKCKDEMPPKDNSPDVCRTALGWPEAKANMTPALGYGYGGGSSRDYMDVKNVERPRFGHKV